MPKVIQQPLSRSQPQQQGGLNDPVLRVAMGQTIEAGVGMNISWKRQWIWQGIDEEIFETEDDFNSC